MLNIYKKTPLYDKHIALGAKMIPYAGWLLPERYGAGLIEEHLAVRRRIGIFDVSHMGEVFISGPDALMNLQRIFTNDFAGMKEGKIRYTVMCDDSGGILDDMLVYCMGQDRYMIVVNASNREPDFEWMSNKISGDVVLADASDQTAQIAVQGPLAASLVAKLAGPPLCEPGEQDEQTEPDESGESMNLADIVLPAKRYTFKDGVSIAGTKCLVSRTGYTGEDGFELYCAPDGAGRLWDALLETPGDIRAVPCGLGARDTLRLEAAMPLYGHEMDRGISPLETGLDFAVKFKKGDFIGKEAMLAAGSPMRKRVGIKMTGRGIARENYNVIMEERVIGRTTSGTFCPFLGYAAAMALVESNIASGARVYVDIRNKLIEAEIVPLPFYSIK